MGRFLGILATLLMIGGASSRAFAEEAVSSQSPAAVSKDDSKDAKSSANDSSDSVFSPDGLARDVMNLMTGLSHPIDATTSLTVQAGKELRIGLSF